MDVSARYSTAFPGLVAGDGHVVVGSSAHCHGTGLCVDRTSLEDGGNAVGHTEQPRVGNPLKHGKTFLN